MHYLPTTCVICLTPTPSAAGFQSIAVIDEGEYVRPTDDVDKAMLSAVMKKAAFEGAAAVQRAAREGEILKCSGTFATASQNDKHVTVWEMQVAAKKDGEASKPNDNVATLAEAHKLEHEGAVTALVATPKRILAGDNGGVVTLWERQRGGLLGGWDGGGGQGASWSRLRQCTPWKSTGLVHPKEKLAQRVVGLCRLGDEGFAAGAASGVVRVWDDVWTGAKEAVLRKKDHASSVKITAAGLAGITALPDFTNPKTGIRRKAFAVASTDGKLASLALLPKRSSAHKNELVMFHVCPVA